jgi:fused signal recognition particle receptor
MFSFLKKKIKETSEKIAEEIEEESKTVSENQISEEEKQELEREKKGFFKKLFSKKKKEEEVIEESKEITEEVKVEEKEVNEEQTEFVETPIKESVIEKVEIKEVVKKEEVKEEKVEKIIKETPKKTEEETIKEEPKEKLVKERKILGIFKKKHKENGEKEIFKEEFHAPEKPHISEEKENVKVPIKKEKLIDPTKKKKGFLKKLSEKIIKLNITDEKFDELFWGLEVALLENNVAVQVIEKIKENLKQELESTKITRRSINEIILNNLRQTIESLFDYEPIDILEKIRTSKKPYKILMLGVNGSGKTTTIGKLIKYFQDNNLSCVVAASDTFRAAAIQQIEEHTNNLNTKLIKQDYGADPAAVAYDAIEHAKSKAIDVVLIDTAGRLHSNSNLMQELEKIIRVSKPDMKIFIGESITGNDCVEQATQFNNAVGIDSIILTKADVDEKGGAAISISHVTEKPIMFITTGQDYKDLKKFSAQGIIDSIFEE